MTTEILSLGWLLGTNTGHGILYIESYLPPFRGWQDGFLLLEATQTTLSNVMLLAVNYDIILHFSHGYFAFASCKTNKYECIEYRMQKKVKSKATPWYLWACRRPLCTWHLLECILYLRLGDYHPLTLSNSAGARGQHRCTPGFVGGPRSTTEEKQSSIIFTMRPFPMNPIWFGSILTFFAFIFVFDR